MYIIERERERERGREGGREGEGGRGEGGRVGMPWQPELEASHELPCTPLGSLPAKGTDSEAQQAQ